MGNIALIKTKYDILKNDFFSICIIEWNNVDPSLRYSNSILVFKENILNFIRSSPNYFFDCKSSKGIKHIKRLGLRHLREHKFKHSFQVNTIVYSKFT